MKKLLPALVLLLLLTLGMTSLPAADHPPPPMAEPSADKVVATRRGARTIADGMRTENTDVIVLAGDFDLRATALVSAAHAAPMLPRVAAAPMVSDIPEEQQPPVIGAWFIGFGLLAFVISRRRFKK